MWIFEIDALVADFRHRRRGFGRDLQGAQSIRHEQDQIMRRAVLRGCDAGGQHDHASGQQ